MSRTVEDLIRGAAEDALGVSGDPLQIQVRDTGIRAYNHYGQQIWDSWPWNNAKLDIFAAPAAVSGVITFGSTIDVIRGIRCVDSQDNSSAVFNQDEVLAVQNNTVGTIGSDRFEYLADDGSGNRRIKVGDIGDDNTVYVLALKRFVPTDTTTYQTDTFGIDRAEAALSEYMSDSMRKWGGIQPLGEGSQSLALAIEKETITEQKEQRVTPRLGMFSEVGTLWGG